MWLLKTTSGGSSFCENIKTLQLVLSTLHRQGDGGFIFKIKTNPLQDAIIIASIIGNLLSAYNEERIVRPKKSLDTVRSRIKKFMASRSKSNKKEFLKAVLYADTAWKKTTRHFSKQKLEIEVVSMTIRLYGLYDKELSRYANINDKQIEAFAYQAEQKIEAYIEKNSYEMADFLLDEISRFTGKKPKQFNLCKSNLKTTKEQTWY